MNRAVAIFSAFLIRVDGDCSKETPCKMNNIDYIGRGYDLANGNPHCDSESCKAFAGLDPGWAKTSPVIAIEYDGAVSGDGRFLKPVGFDLLRTVSCSMRANTVSVHSLQEYQRALAVDASVSGGGFLWAFSASADYQSTGQTLSSQTRTQYQTTASCNVYTAKILPDCTLPLATNFKKGVANLPATYDAQKYLSFVTNYGTHYSSSTFMGAKITYSMEFSSLDVQKMSSMGVNVAAAVSVNAIIAKAAVGVKVGWHESDFSSMSQFQSKNATVLVGNAPPQPFGCKGPPCSPDQIDLSSWQTFLLSDKADLMPLSYSLTSIGTLLTSAYFPEDKDIAAKAYNFQQFLENSYCGTVPNCAPPNPNGYWTRQPSLLLPTVAAAGVTSGSFFVIGGLDSDLKSSSAVQMLLSQDSGIRWIMGPSMPTPRHNFTACKDLDGSIYAFGGQRSGSSDMVDAVERLDVRTNQWNSQKPMPRPRYSQASAFFSNQIWILGGSKLGQTTNIVDVYMSDIDSWELAPSMLSPREGHCVGVIKGILYAAGGFDSTSGSFLRSVEAFINGSWIAQPSMLYARSGAVCGVVQDSLVIFGGVNAGGVVRLVEAFVDGRWIRRSDGLGTLWFGSGAVALDYAEQTNKLFVAGGISEGFGGGLIWSFVRNGVYSSPVLSSDNKMVYIGSTGKNLYAIDAVTGVKKWTFLAGGPVRYSPVLSSDNKVVYVGSEDNNLYAVDAVTGVKKWAFLTGGYIRSPPALSSDNKMLYVGSNDGNLYAIDAFTGVKKWTFLTGGPVSSSPALSSDNKMVYVGSEDKNLYAIDAVTGVKKWTFLTGAPIYSSPALSSDNEMLYLGSYANNLYAINAFTGVKKWTFSAGSTFYSPVLSSDNKMIYVGSYDKNLYAIDAFTGVKKWTFLTGGPIRYSPTLSSDNKRVYVGSEDKNLYAIDAVTGVKKWTFLTGGPIYSSPALSSDNKMLYVGSNDGNLYAVSAQIGIPLSECTSFYPEV